MGLQFLGRKSCTKIKILAKFFQDASCQSRVWTKFSDEPWVISIDGDCTIDESTYLCTQCQERHCRGAPIGGVCLGDSYACRIKGLNKGSIACPLKARSMSKCCTSTGSNKL